MCCPPYITGPDPGISARLMHVECMTHMHLTTYSHPLRVQCVGGINVVCSRSAKLVCKLVCKVPLHVSREGGEEVFGDLHGEGGGVLHGESSKRLRWGVMHARLT